MNLILPGVREAAKHGRGGLFHMRKKENSFFQETYRERGYRAET